MSRKVKWKKPKKKLKPIVLLVDGDIIAYQAVTEAMEETRTSDDEWTYTINMKTVRDLLEARMEEHERDLRADKSVMFFGSRRGNWRMKVMPEYKANRTGKKPLGYWTCVDWMMKRWTSKRVTPFEADDIIGVAATDKNFMPDHDKIIVSEDKDFHCVPCSLYVPRKPEDGVKVVTKAEADEFHLLQTLTGDATDGYKGCPGAGPVKATMILQSRGLEATPREKWEAIVEAYETADLTEKDALRNARVARILRASDIDADGKPILWNPPKKMKLKKRRSRAEAKKAQG